MGPRFLPRKGPRVKFRSGGAASGAPATGCLPVSLLLQQASTPHPCRCYRSSDAVPQERAQTFRMKIRSRRRKSWEKEADVEFNVRFACFLLCARTTTVWLDDCRNASQCRWNTASMHNLPPIWTQASRIGPQQNVNFCRLSPCLCLSHHSQVRYTRMT